MHGIAHTCMACWLLAGYPPPALSSATFAVVQYQSGCATRSGAERSASSVFLFPKHSRPTRPTKLVRPLRSPNSAHNRVSSRTIGNGGDTTQRALIRLIALPHILVNTTPNTIIKKERDLCVKPAGGKETPGKRKTTYNLPHVAQD